MAVTSKANCPMRSHFSGIFIFLKLEHLSHAQNPMYTTSSGIIISQMYLLYSKAQSPIFFTSEGILNVFLSSAGGYKMRISPFALYTIPSTTLIPLFISPVPVMAYSFMFLQS